MLVEKSEVKKQGSPKSRIRQNPYLQGGPFILTGVFVPVGLFLFLRPTTRQDYHNGQNDAIVPPVPRVPS